MHSLMMSSDSLPRLRSKRSSPERLPPASRAQFAANRQRVMQVLNNLFLNRAAARDARAAGLDKDPTIAGLWAYLIHAPAAEILALPLVVEQLGGALMADDDR